MITHFFNPPRYMRLLEVVAGEHTARGALDAIRHFCDVALGKGVVECKDTPGFIGNRIGIYWIQRAVSEAIRLGLTVEEADAVAGRPMGIPKTGVFGLSDLVGLDLMPHVLSSLAANLPPDDAFFEVKQLPPVVQEMIAEGYIGRKGKGGFYRLNRQHGKKLKEAKDLQTGEYRPTGQVHLKCLDASKQGGLRALVECEDKGGQFAWSVLSHTLSYAASCVPQITETVVSLDAGMKLGFNWSQGPFEMLDTLGTKWFCDRLRTEGRPVPPLLEMTQGRAFYRVNNGMPEYLTVEGEYRAMVRAEGVLLLRDIKLSAKPLAKNTSASLWDIGDGVVCVEFHSKMNAIDPAILALVQQALKLVGESSEYQAIVLHNEAENFSVGANIGHAMFAINLADWAALEGMVKQGQEVFQALKNAPFPVVGAPSGMALGGGCEILLHCDAVQAHAETYMGLVEVGVGLVPGWGGCKELLQRWFSNPRRPGGPMPPITKVFEAISTATVSRSATEAQDLMLLRAADGISMNRDRLLYDAKAKALSLVKDYTPRQEPEVRLPGPSAKAAMRLAVHNFRLLGKATPYDEVVADALSNVLSGGDTDISETLDGGDLLKLEREAFLALARNPGTMQRIETMLSTGKPLRN